MDVPSSLQRVSSTTVYFIDQAFYSTLVPNLFSDNEDPNEDYKQSIPECPICSSRESNYIRLTGCGHVICQCCLKSYIVADIKNISKYPFKCFQFKCDQLLHIKDVKYAFRKSHFSARERDIEKYKARKLLQIYEKFSILCAISPNERDTCPKCEMIFFVQSAGTRVFNWICDGARTSCSNMKCLATFTFFNRRHHCRFCGEIFCDQCSKHQLPIAYAHPRIKNNFVHNNSDKISGIYSAKTEETTNFTASELDRLQQTMCRSCYRCWLRHYRAVCADCDYQYCTKCRHEWHPRIDCQQMKQQLQMLQAQREAREFRARQTEDFMLTENYRRCPGCRVFVAKDEGCNHMTHTKCPNPNRGDSNTHFCYCCGDRLYDPHHKHEKNGTVHFPDGVFQVCRKNEFAKTQRQQEHDQVKQYLKCKVTQEDVDADKTNSTQCVLM